MSWTPADYELQRQVILGRPVRACGQLDPADVNGEGHARGTVHRPRPSHGHRQRGAPGWPGGAAALLSSRTVPLYVKAREAQLGRQCCC
jgi:hypothetical protein